MALPVDVRDLMKTGARFTEERSQQIGIAVLVEVDAPDTLIDAVRRELRPATAAVMLQIEVAELGAAPVVAPGTDVVIAIAGSGNVGLQQALVGPRRSRLPLVVVALGDEARAGALADVLLHPTGDIVVRDEPDEAVARLGAWLADNIGSKRLALAHNFAFMRRAVAEDAVRTTALQNGLVGAVTPIPGADMPIMTANQAKMVLQIAAAYGEQLGAERARELLGVVGGGFLLRMLARQAVAFVPGFGWAIKGGIGYSGTLAMGYAAIKYFEGGADLGDLEVRLKAYGATIAERLRGMSRRDAKRLAAEQGVYVPEALPAAQPTAVLPAAGASGVLPAAEPQATLPFAAEEPSPS